MGNSIASIQYIANILKNKKLCLDTSPMTNGYNKGERTWNVARLKFTTVTLYWCKLVYSYHF